MTRLFSTRAIAALLAIGVFTWSCTKLDTTNLGGDLIPVVDNINTFADTFDIITSQGFFDNDTTKTYRTSDQVLGKITSDPLFGETDASIYFQPKPGFFPFYWGSSRDTVIGFDSVVLTLNYRGHFGNANIPQQLQVSAIPANAGGLYDSLFQPLPITYAPPTGQVIGEKTVNISTLGSYTKFAHGEDSAQNQIRIKLDSTWGAGIFFLDSSATGANNAFYKDSLFRTRFKGVAVKALSGEALMYINLADSRTRMEFHFRKRRNNVVDTIYSSLTVNTNDFGSRLPSSTANKLVRNRSTGQYPPAGPADEIFIQAQPGTFASLSIPELNAFKDTNRIIHNARIRVEQIPHDFLTDSVFAAPVYVYLDLRDTTVAETYKPLYYDLNPGVFYDPDYKGGSTPFYPGSVEFGYFGGFAKRRIDMLTGRNIVYYDLNLTRYIQRMVTQDAPNYTMRLFAPYTFSYPQFVPEIIPYNNSLAAGRVRVGGSNGPYRMRMIVVYSKVPE